MLLILSMLLLISVGSVSAASFVIEQKLTPADFTTDTPVNIPDHEYGSAVAVHGVWMAVGAPSAQSNRGTVYIYERVSGAWVYRTQLVSPAPQNGAQFGAAVDIYEAGGLLTVIVGAPLHDIAPYVDRGSAYIFSDTNAGAGFSFTTVTLTSTAETDAHFGASVALFADLAAVGAPNDGTTDDGLVSIRGRNVGGSNAWGQIGASKIGQPGTAFGTSVDLHGEYLIVGAPLMTNVASLPTGAAYIYRQDLGGANAWGLKHTLTPSWGQPNGMFGQSVGIWDSNLGGADSASRSVVGAPLYDDAGDVDAGHLAFFADGAINAQFNGEDPNEQLGFSVALEDTLALAGRPGRTVSSQPNVGSVNTYRFNGTIWLTNTINLSAAGGGATNDQFGYTVDISGTLAAAGAPGARRDALTLPPGAPRAGALTTLEYVSPSFVVSTPELIARVDLPNTAVDQNFGIALDMTDEWLVVGVRGDAVNGSTAGAAYVYRNVSGVWTPHSRLTPLYSSAGQSFGQSVTIVGNQIIIGAPGMGGFPVGTSNSGAFYVYQWSGSVWSQIAEITSPNPTVNGFFGASISRHGDVLAVGATGENGSRGRVYAYRNFSTFASPTVIDVPAASVNSATGYSVSVYDPAPGTPNDEVIAIGAYNENSGQGAAYVASGATFSTITTLVDPNPGTNRYFGYSVSIHSGRVAVGAPTATAAPSGRVVVFSGSGYATANTLPAATGSAGQFGFSVDLENTSLVVGSVATAGRTGLAHVYSFTAGGWTEQGPLQPTDLNTFDEFGHAVTQSNGQYVVSAPLHDANSISNSGAAYVFTLAPEITVDPTTLNVSETGPTTDTFTVSLNQTPPTNVTITLTFDTQVQVNTGSGFGASPQTVTLTPANATTGVTVSVRAVDDFIDEADPHTTTITTSATSSATPRFNGLAVDDVTVNITDNDTAGVTITQTGASTDVSESGTTDTYTIVLDTQPTGTVNVAITFPATDLTINGDTDGTYNTTFNAGNWNTPQTITVAAVNDRNFESDHTGSIVHAFTSADANYNGITALLDGTTATNTITANITDNETLELRWVNATGSGAEGTTYSQNVVMDITSDPIGGTPQNEVAVSFEAPITFLTAEAADIQVLFLNQTISAGNNDGALFAVFHNFLSDTLIEGDETFSMAIAITTPYPGLTAGTDHTATITDANTATVSLTGGTTVAESVGTTPLTVTLNTSAGDTLENALTAAINLTDGTATYGGGTGDFAFSGPANTTSVTFTAGSGNGATRVVNVGITEDVLVEGTENFSAAIGTVTGPATVSGTAQTITITDNEAATISFATTSSSTPEASTPHTVNAQLNITSVGTGTPQLQSAVSVAVSQTPGTAATPADYTLSTTSITFPAGAQSGNTQPIDIAIVNDGIDEADETFTLGFGAVSGAATASGTHTVTIIDDDTAGITVTESGGSTDVTEGGATDSYTVVLDSEPTSNVVINITFDAAQLILNGDTDGALALTFTPANWFTAQTVNVTAVDDTLVETNPHSSLIVQTAASADAIYNAINPADVTVTITENDFQEITFSLTSSAVAENAGPHTVNARLDLISNGTPGGTISSDMTATVNLTLGSASAGDQSLTTTSITFPAGSTHASTRPISIGITNDRLLEGDETFTLSFTLVTATGTVSGTHTVTITDNETATLSFTNLSQNFAENVGSATTPVELVITGSGTGGPNFATQGAVTVQITDTAGTAANPADYTLTTTSLTFPAGTETGTSLNVATAIVSDRVFEADETYSLSFGTVTASGAVTTGSAHTATIVDDETVNFAIAPATNSVPESGGNHVSTVTMTVTGTGTGTASIQSAFSVPVIYTDITATAPADYTLGVPLVTFPAGSESGETRDITVGIISDAIDEADETFSINLDTSIAASDVTFGNATTTVTIIDDDTAEVVIIQSGGSTDVTEGGAQDLYNITLASQPTANVDVTLNFNTQLEVSTDGVNYLPSPVTVSFTPGTWNTLRTITVRAINDTIVEGPHTATISHTAVSSDPLYNGFVTASVVVNITDNDTAEVIFSSAGFTVIEGAVFSPGMTLKVTGNGAPGGSIANPIVVDLLLTLGTAEASDVTITTAQATFPAGAVHDDVNSTHSVSVTNDLIVERTEDFTLTLDIASGLASTTASNTYDISSDDTAAVSFSATTSTAPEAVTPHIVSAQITLSGTGTGTPSIEEAITVAVLDTAGTATAADYSLTTTSITFAAGSLNAATANIASAIVNDALIEGPHSFDLGFGAVTTDLTGVSASGTHTVTIIDDDFAGVTIVETGGTTNVTEGGATDTFTITLNAQPTSDVTITFDVGTQVTFAPNPLVISPADWNVPQTVTVTAVDDVIIEGAHSTVVGFTFTGDADFAAITPNSIGVTVNITDNDIPGIDVVETDGSSLVVEGGADDQFSVALFTQPSADVTITFDGGSQLTLAPASVTFTPTDWNVPQTVTITGIDDRILEGLHSGTVGFVFTSADSNYNGLTWPALSVTIVDGDSEVLRNGSFETAGAKPAFAANWVRKNLSVKDRRVCNTLSSTVAFEGNCAFRFNFTGPVNVNRFIRQTIASPAWGEAGDSLTFSAMVRTIGLTNGARLLARINYTDNTFEVIRLDVASGTQPYTLYTGNRTLSKRVKSVVVTLNARTTNGRMFLDAVSLLYTDGTPMLSPRLPTPDIDGAAPLPLPMPPASN
jgi:hypothetical protein